MAGWKRKVLSVLALLISLGYLYRHTDLEELELAMKTASPEYLLLAFCLSLLTVLLSVLRWHIFLREVQETPFKKTLRAFLSGYYLMTILPPSVGHATKVKLVGGDYFKALSALAIGITTEVVVLLSMAFVFVGFTKLGLVVLVLVLLSLIWEEGLYRVLDSLLAFWGNSGLKGLTTLLRSYLKRGYTGWKRAKENRKAFFLSFLLSLAVILLQVFGIVAVGRAFGLEVSLGRALYGFIMSVLFASLAGIPSGFGANEMGIVVGIGASTKATLTAFTYKFIFQYVYSIVGAVAFYRSVGGGAGK
ncbi:ABC transporter [Thermococcus profundus]|uniref:ABC transporter n=1 Tax=Thermococcus profundus TaxID=49899 RepID=A0A2Z2MIV9_THEPR|nr:ABC transporter [Thermococcus profundus]